MKAAETSVIEIPIIIVMIIAIITLMIMVITATTIRSRPTLLLRVI